MRLKAGQDYTPFQCRVTRLISSTPEKTIYDVDWQGTQVVLKLTSAPPVLPATHPRWARVLEWASLPEGCAFLQEKVPGSTLATVLKFGKPSLEQRLDWAAQLVEFFETSSPTAGRLDPSNVLVGDDGQLRLISLGPSGAQETPMTSVGSFLELALSDSVPMAWLAARCRDGRFKDLRQVSEMLHEFSAQESGNDFELPAEAPEKRPLWPVFSALVLVVVLLMTFWSRPLHRNEPAIYLAQGDKVRLLSESSGQSLGSFSTADDVTAMAASQSQGRLYLAYRDSPYIDVLEGRTHQPVGRLLSQPGASKLYLSGKTLVAVYPNLSLVVLTDTEGKSAQPVSLGEGEPRVAVAGGVLGVASGSRLEVYQITPFALLQTVELTSTIQDLWVEGEELRLAEGGRLRAIESGSGRLLDKPGDYHPQRAGLETPHGFWVLEGARLVKQVGKEGSVLDSWPVEPDAAVAYLGGGDAP